LSGLLKTELVPLDAFVGTKVVKRPCFTGSGVQILAHPASSSPPASPLLSKLFFFLRVCFTTLALNEGVMIMLIIKSGFPEEHIQE
jgi:hypothetical protein